MRSPNHSTALRIRWHGRLIRKLYMPTRRTRVRAAFSPSASRPAPPSRSPATATSAALISQRIGSIYSRDALDSPAQVYEMKIGGAPRALTHAGQDTLAQTAFVLLRSVQFSRMERRDSARLCRAAGQLSRRSKISGCLSHSRRTARILRQCLELSLESASLGGHGLRRGDGGFSRLERLRRGIR